MAGKRVANASLGQGFAGGAEPSLTTPLHSMFSPGSFLLTASGNIKTAECSWHRASMYSMTTMRSSIPD